MLVLYDLVAHQNPPGSGSYFSPATIKARLALLHKGIEFRTQDVRYNDLRFTWKDKLGVEKATGTRLGGTQELDPGLVLCTCRPTL